MLPLALVHGQRVAHRVEVERIAGYAVEVQIPLQRGQQRAVRMVAGVLVYGAVVVARELLKPPALLVVAARHVYVGCRAHGAVVQARVGQYALEAQVHVLDKGQHVAPVEEVAKAPRQAKRALLARVARVQQAEGQPGARVVGVFARAELIARYGQQEAVRLLPARYLVQQRAHHRAQPAVLAPHQARARAHQELAGRLALEVVFKMTGVAGIGHAGGGPPLMHPVPVKHPVQVEAL